MKRFRHRANVNSLSGQDAEILIKAASILEVHVESLPTALSDLSKSLDSGKRPSLKPRPLLGKSLQVYPEMEKLPPPEMSSWQQNSPQRRYLGPFQSRGSAKISRPQIANNSCIPSSFGFGFSRRITECFGSSSFSTPELDSPAQHGSYSYLPTYLDTPSSMEQANTLSSIFSEQRTESNDPVSLLDGSGMPSNGFACDEFAPGGLQWMDEMDNPTNFPFTQPFGTLEPMTYPDNLSSEQPLINLTDPTVQAATGPLHMDISRPAEPSHSPFGSDAGADRELSMNQTCPVPRRKFQSAQDRQQTAETRKLTACLRCRMQRIRCHPDPANPRGTCLTCQRVMKPTLRKLPCLRYKLTEVRLFREGSFAVGHEWSHRWSGKTLDDITHWASSEVKMVQVTQDYSPSPISFEVREFEPMPGDKLQRRWVHEGVQKTATLPNYAILNMKDAVKAHREFIVNEGPYFFKNTLNYNDRLLSGTYTMALKLSNDAATPDERNLLQMVLQLWVTVRMCSKSARISGSETLGMSSDLLDESSPLYGKIPVPPVLGAQSNFIVTNILQGPLKTKILDLLQKLTLAQRPETWFCIYLSNFILLHNCSLLTEHDIGYARKHGLRTKHARPDMISELHLGANILLAHFHYCCKGFKPFALDWNPNDTTSMAKLDDEQVKFLQQTAVCVNANEVRFKRLLNEGSYDSEHYFVAQLYEDDWKPRSTP